MSDLVYSSYFQTKESQLPALQVSLPAGSLLRRGITFPGIALFTCLRSKPGATSQPPSAKPPTERRCLRPREGGRGRSAQGTNPPQFPPPARPYDPAPEAVTSPRTRVPRPTPVCTSTQSSHLAVVLHVASCCSSGGGDLNFDITHLPLLPVLTARGMQPVCHISRSAVPSRCTLQNTKAVPTRGSTATPYSSPRSALAHSASAISTAPPTSPQPAELSRQPSASRPLS